MPAIYHRFNGILTWKRLWSVLYWFWNEVAWAIDYQSTSFPGAAVEMLVFIYEWTKKKRSRHERSECLTKLNGRKARIHRNCSIDVIYFLTEEISAGQKPMFISWNCAKKSQSSEESQRGDKLVRNLKIFWMNNEIYIAFGFRMMRRIMQISEDFIHWGWRPSTVSFASPFILSPTLLRWSRDNTHLTQSEIVFNSRDLVLRE